MGGLFLFVPYLIHLDCEALALNAKLPGARMIPAGHALRASLALKQSGEGARRLQVVYACRAWAARTALMRSPSRGSNREPCGPPP